MLKTIHLDMGRNARSNVLDLGVDFDFASDVPETGRMDGLETSRIGTAHGETERNATDRAEPA